LRATRGQGSLPAEAKAADTTKPTTVVGTGTSASCTFSALTAAVSKGGTITFDCGDGLATIPVTATLTLQHIRLSNGKTTPTQAIPACPASGSIPNTMCSTGFDDGEGGAIYMQHGKRVWSRHLSDRRWIERPAHHR
jgi:hypothetical protein